VISARYALILMASMAVSNDFDLDQCPLGQGLDRHAGAGGLFGEVGGIDLVEGGEISHVAQKTGGFDDIAHCRTGGSQNGLQIFADAVGLLGDVLTYHASRSGIEGDLSGGEDKVVDDHGLGIGADGGRGIVGMDLGAHAVFPFRAGARHAVFCFLL